MRNPKTETGGQGARSALECGGKRSATPLWPATPHRRRSQSAVAARALPAHSKTWRLRLAFLLILLPSSFCLPAWAQYSIDWHTIDGGGGTSTGGVHTVSGTIGQSDAGAMSGGHFTLGGGFWALPGLVQTPGAPTLYITNAASGWATIWWNPPAAGFVLQENPNLSPTNWTYSLSGATNPVVVPAILPARFYRLHKP